MARRAYYHQEGAPRANSLVVAATAYVENSSGEVLLIRRSDNGKWALPGGQQEIGETTAACVERETLEETGYQIRAETVLDVLSDPGHVIAYADGEVRQEFVVLYRAALTGGTPRTSSESVQIVWTPSADIATLDLPPWIQRRVELGRRHDR